VREKEEEVPFFSSFFWLSDSGDIEANKS